MLRDHVGDESKSFGLLGQFVNGEVDLREGSCRRQGLVVTGPCTALKWHLPDTVRDEGNSSGCVLSHQPGPGAAEDKVGPGQAPQAQVWQLMGSDR